MLAIKADCDGRRIVLPPQGNYPAGPVIVIFERADSDNEPKDWRQLSVAGLARAYGEDEPDYSLKLVRETNPEYGNQRR